MKNNNDQHTNFWFGFAVGTIAAAAGSYLLGTKDGRNTVKKLLVLSENLEENLIDIRTQFKQELSQGLKNHEATIQEVKSGVEHIQAAITEQIQKPEAQKPLAEILQKIHTLSPIKNLPDKFSSDKNP